MSAPESHIPEVPGPPTWREYLDARLAILATKDDLREAEQRLIGRMDDRIDRTDGKIDSLRKDVATGRRWLIGLFVTLIGVSIALASLILSLRPAP